MENLQINFKDPRHKKLLDAIRKRWYFSRDSMSKRYGDWAKFEDQFVAYLPTKETDKKREILKSAGSPQYVTIEVPYSYAQVLAAHTYWTSVFLGRTPVFQYQGRHGEPEQSVQAIEAVIDYQMQVGQMLVPFYIWLLDPAKYGLGILGTYWAEESAVITELVKKPKMMFDRIPIPGTEKTVKQSKKVRGYTGNKVYNVRPYDFFPDPRVPVSQFQQGEFVGRFCEIGLNHILKQGADGKFFNIDEAKKSKASGWNRDRGSSRLDVPNQGTPGGQYGGPTGSTQSSDDDNLHYYEVLEFHWELVPNDWGLGTGTYPEKWVFTIINDSVIVAAQPLGLFHNQFPFSVLEYEAEGYGIFKRSMLEIMKPLNDTLTWLFNSHFYNVRSILNGQFVVDPSRIAMKDAQDPAPGRMWRLKPAAYGSDPKLAVHQFQVFDVTQNHMRDAQIVMDMLQRLTGVTDNLMGLVNAGGRKTATEVRTSSSFGINRLKTNAEYFSSQGWAPLSQMFVQTTQQRMDAGLKYRIAGELMQTAQSFMDVSPETIMGFYDFVPVDGTLPVDRFAQASLWKDLMMQLRAMPDIMMQYDMGSIFSYVAQLAGLKNINQFKLQISDDAKLLAQMQAGNVIPLGGKNAGGRSSQPRSAATGTSGPSQSAGLGPTM